MPKIARRAALIDTYYVLSSIAIILLLTAASGSIKNAVSFILLREEPISAIWSTMSGLQSTQIFKWLLMAVWAFVIGSFLYRFSFFLSSRFQFEFDWFRISDATKLPI